MPKRSRVAKKRKPKRLSESSKSKLAEIGEGVSVDTLTTILDDFDIQAEKMAAQFSRKYKREVRKFLNFIPTKGSIPKDIAQMSLYEFKRRGNSLDAVMESIKKERQIATEGLTTANAVPVNNENVDYVTPACNTRSKQATNVLRNTAVRKPQPLEALSVVMQSKVTGSPVDGEAVLHAHTSDTIEGMSEMMAQKLTALLPLCHRSKVMKTIREVKNQMLSTGKDVTVTPAIIR